MDRTLVRKLRPGKARNALRRRWFENRVSRTEMTEIPGLVALGGDYGGWIIPGNLIDPGWICYLVGAGGDVTTDLELCRRYGARARSFEAVADYVERAEKQADGEPLFTAHHAAIALEDGPIRMQVTHDPGSQSVSAARLYESTSYVELPGRSLASLMAELGDQQIDLLKIDIEGSEYEVLPSLDLPALGVKVFAVQLHHNGSVAAARKLIAELREQGYTPVACKSAVKLTFVRTDLL